MKIIIKYINRIPVFLLFLFVSVKASSQVTDYKDYCIVGYYASSATSSFKTPFIFSFGENNTFEKLEIDGKIHEGKYTVVNGNIKFEFIGGEENFKVDGTTLTPVSNRTFAKLEKKIFGNRLKGNRYTGILYKQKSTETLRTSYQFIGTKFSITDEKGVVTSYDEYNLVGNLAGYKLGGIKSKIKRSIFVLYGNQLVVMNIYRDDTATYGILDLVTKN